MFEKKQRNFTSYQKSLLAKPKKWPGWVQVCMMTLTALLGTAYLFEIQGKLPVSVKGWTIFLTILLQAALWFLFGVFTLIWGCLLLAKKALEIPQLTFVEADFEELNFRDKIQYKSKKVVLSFCKTNWERRKAVDIIDIAIDAFLFVMLVTATHPFLALSHGLVVSLQHLMFGKVRESVYDCVELFSDSLEGSKEETIDELMDKLLEGE